MIGITDMILAAVPVWVRVLFLVVAVVSIFAILTVLFYVVNIQPQKELEEKAGDQRYEVMEMSAQRSVGFFIDKSGLNC